MTVEQEMKDVFLQYSNEEIINIEIIEKNYEHLNDYRKYAFIKTDKQKEYIIKAYRNGYNTPRQVEGYGELSQVFYDAGIKVARFYKNKDNVYLTQHNFKDGSYLSWCEERLPYTVFDNRDNLGKDFYSRMGALLGRMHFISRENQCSYPWHGAMVLFNTMSVEDEFDENYENAKSFYESLRSSELNKDLLNEIWVTYNNKRNDLEAIYPKLHLGAVQGDLSLCNILKDDDYNPVAIIDFNQSGNDRYVNDMVHWLIYFVFDFSTKEFNTELKKNFIDFYNGYTKHYSFNEDELLSFNGLYNIIRPFRYYERESVVIDFLKEGNVDEANKHLEWILYELRREDILDILDVSNIN